MEELAAYCVPKDPACPVQAGGYVVACAAFYGRVFGVLAHYFLYSLLQCYGLELHHVTPSGILNKAAFETV
jgi:hypothetical protein